MTDEHSTESHQRVPLSPELLSIVQHTELNNAAWWDRTIQRLIVTVLWFSGEPLTFDQIGIAARRDYALDIDRRRLKAQLEVMCRTQTQVVCLASGSYKLTEQYKKEYETEIAKAQAVQDAARIQFCQLISQLCAGLDCSEVWPEFLKRFFEPYIREFGAHIYRLISDGEPMLPLHKLDTFLDSYPDVEREGLREALTRFLHPKEAAAREFVLRSLNAYFFVEAGCLSERVVQNLSKAIKRNATFRVYVDTNVLLYLLGLKEDDFATALSVVDLIERLNGRVSIKLYVLPITIDETKRVISAAQQELRGVRVTEALARAAISAGLDGIAKRYVIEASQRSTGIDAEAYFGHYLSDLTTVIKTRGAELANVNLDRLKMQNAVIDDILGQQAFEEKRYKERAKTYPVLEHDVTMWHYVSGLRPSRLESPLEASSWILTLDRRLLAFDSYKRDQNGGSVPICMHPATFIQLLQFWLPRSAQFEEALLGSMGLPFFQEFDSASEHVTLRILKQLGRFEDVARLPEEAARKILVNDAMRQKLATSDIEEEAEIKLIKDAFIAQLADRNNRLQLLQNENTTLNESLLSKEQEVHDLRTALKAKEDAFASEMSRKEGLASERESEFLNRVSILEAQMKLQITTQSERERRKKFVLAFVLPPLPVIAVVPIVVYRLSWQIPFCSLRNSAMVCSAVAAFGYVLWLNREGQKNASVFQSRPFRMYQKFYAKLLALLGLIVGGVMVNAIFEWLRNGGMAR